MNNSQNSGSQKKPQTFKKEFKGAKKVFKKTFKNSDKFKNIKEESNFVVGEIYEGSIFFGRNGVGYVRILEEEHVIEVPSYETGNTFHRDDVKARIKTLDNTTGAIGEVVEVTNSKYFGHTCTLEKKGEHIYGIPTDRHNRHREILLPNIDFTGHTMNERVFVNIQKWEDTPVGTISEWLGEMDDYNGIMRGYALEQGFSESFPDDVDAEADTLAHKGITDEDRAGRRDMRGITTFTIDPDDAKDFDDALSFQTLEDGNLEIGVHIADVSHYVRNGSALDAEAQERATSVYLVDRTIPMLPEALSNNLCSLRPNEEKCAFSAIFTITPTGDMVSEWFGRTLIESDKRFTYMEAQEVMDAGSGLFYDELTKTNEIAKRYQKERIANGAMSLEKEELRFVLDETGKPIEVRKKSRQDVHKMIEEWMLMANKHVAKYVAGKAGAQNMIYRIHDKPELERMQSLQTFLVDMGHDVKMKDGVIPPHVLKEVLDNTTDDDEKDVISLHIARSMQKAIYSMDNVGHYGLGFSFYTHFTSPIRRYPDVIAHRILQKAIDDQVINREEYTEYRRLAQHSSDREKNASLAERASIKYAQMRYLEDKVGQFFTGLITGVNARGAFISEDDTRADGFSRLREMNLGFLSYDDDKRILHTRDKSVILRVGTRVKMKLTEIDIKNGFINYELMELISK